MILFKEGSHLLEVSDDIEKRKMIEKYDRIIIGAGLYGLYSALFCGRRIKWKTERKNWNFG